MIINSPSAITILIFFLLLLLNYLFFLQRIFIGFRKLKPSTNSNLPREFISVIIPFRNEAENILDNLKAIESQLYPSEKFEIIYVNDFSEDDSLEILTNNIKNDNIRVMSVPEDYSLNAHKKRAIRYGIENAKGEIIVTTDADCEYDDNWLQVMMSNFDSLTGFVSGPVEFISDKSFFSQFQKLEFAGLVLSGAGLIGSGQPIICNAANIAYRKKVFDEVSGFKDNMNLSSGDDELLMQKIAKDTDFTVKFCFDRRAIVKTKANKSIGDFFQQRKRWASKGLFYRDKNLVLKLIFIYSFYISLIAQLLLAVAISQIFFISLLISIILKLIFEFRILLQGKRKLFVNLKLRYLIPAEFLQIPYILYAGVAGIFGNYLWKSRKVKR